MTVAPDLRSPARRPSQAGRAGRRLVRVGVGVRVRVRVRVREQVAAIEGLAAQAGRGKPLWRGVQAQQEGGGVGRALHLGCHGTWTGTYGGATVRGTYGTPEAGTRPTYVQCVAPRGKLPCASGEIVPVLWRTVSPGHTCQRALHGVDDHRDRAPHRERAPRGLPREECRRLARPRLASPR